MEDTRAEADVFVTVRATRAGKDYTFTFSGPHFSADGDWDFRPGDIGKKKVRMTFALSADSPADLRFLPDGEEAFWAQWIDETGPKGCPKGPYRGPGRQFGDYAVSGDGRTLTLRNKNNTGCAYRYALRFSENGAAVVCDPGGTNGGQGGPP